MHRSMYTLNLHNVLSDVAWASIPSVFSTATQSLKVVTLMFLSFFPPLSSFRKWPKWEKKKKSIKTGVAWVILLQGKNRHECSPSSRHSSAVKDENWIHPLHWVMPLQGFIAHGCREGMSHRNIGWKEPLEVFGPTRGLNGVGLLPALDQISHSFVWPSLENLQRWSFHSLSA